MTIREMKEKRAALVKEARKILDFAESEKRDLSGEENTEYERMMQEVDSIGNKIEREEKLRSVEDNLENRDGTFKNDGEKPKDGEKREFTPVSEEYRSAYSKFLVEGRSALSESELRAMQADSDIGGGYLVAPQQMVMELLKNVDDQVFIRQYAKVIQLKKAKSLGVITLDKDVDDFDWTAELKTGKETDAEFGKRELNPHPLAKRVKISNTLLRMAAMSPESIINERLAYKLAVTQEKAFMTGDGNQKPLGIFTASDKGISTGRDVSTGNTATEIKFDGLIDAKGKLKEQYQRSATTRWMFHRDAITKIRKLKDGNGQYIWTPANGNTPDRILETPYLTSEFAPNTFTTAKYVGAIGDLRYYWIAEALDMAMQRLVELYAETNQTGYIGRYEGDGMPVLEEAFVRVKLG